jgi:hypothetical protein
MERAGGLIGKELPAGDRRRRLFSKTESSVYAPSFFRSTHVTLFEPKQIHNALIGIKKQHAPSQTDSHPVLG